MLLANRIRLLRIARGYSQEYMADRLGISQAAYSKLERRAGNSTVYTLEKVANVLGVTLVFLVDVNNKEVF
jgi:transcriptional regulator with XRE-family HTH domain